MHHLKACGLPNVHLLNGFEIDDDQSVGYVDLKGLYKTLAHAVACRGAGLTAAEFRFLRKRLGKSQLEVGEAVGYSDQAVAKWEKGTSPVPVAAGRLLSAAWLAENARLHVARSIAKMWRAPDFISHGYVLAYKNGRWIDVSDSAELQPIRAQAAHETATIIASVSVQALSTVYASTGAAGQYQVRRVPA